MTSESDAPQKCYRASNLIRIAGPLFAVLLVLLAVANVAICLLLIEPQRMSRTVLLLITEPFYVALAVSSIYYAVYVIRHRLWLSESKIHVRGAFSDQTIPIAQIDQLKWRSHPSTGFVRLAGDFGKVNLELAQFTPSDRDEIVAFFRATVDDARQVDQVQFDRRDDHTSPEALERAEGSRLSIRRSACLFLIAGCGYLIAWPITQWVPCAVAAVAHLLFGCFMWGVSRRRFRHNVA